MRRGMEKRVTTRANLIGLTGHVGRLCVRESRLVLHSFPGLLWTLPWAKLSATETLQALAAIQRKSTPFYYVGSEHGILREKVLAILLTWFRHLTSLFRAAKTVFKTLP